MKLLTRLIEAQSNKDEYICKRSPDIFCVTKHTQEVPVQVSSMLAWILTARARQPVRQVLGSTLIPMAQRSSASVWSDLLVRHHTLPTTTFWQLLLPHQVHRRPSRRSGHDGVCATLSAPQQPALTAWEMRGVTAGCRPANWQELKMDFTAAPGQT